ncbi:unnamed protein product, partial [marine sediment metagenome]
MGDDCRRSYITCDIDNGAGHIQDAFHTKDE